MAEEKIKKEGEKKKQSQADKDFYDPYLCDDIENNKDYDKEISSFVKKIISENK